MELHFRDPNSLAMSPVYGWPDGKSEKVILYKYTEWSTKCNTFNILVNFRVFKFFFFIYSSHSKRLFLAENFSLDYDKL